MRCLAFIQICCMTFLALACSGTQNCQVRIRASESGGDSVLRKRTLLPRSPSGGSSGIGQRRDRARDQIRTPGGSATRQSPAVTNNPGIVGGRADSQTQAAPGNRNSRGNQGQQEGNRGGQDSRPPRSRDRGQGNPQSRDLSARHRQETSRASANPAIRVFHPPIGIPPPVPYAVPDASTPMGFGYREYAGPPPVIISPARSVNPARRAPSGPYHPWPDTRVETVAYGPGRFHANSGRHRQHEYLAAHWTASKDASDPVEVVGGGEVIGHGRVVTRVSGRKAHTRVDPGPGGVAKIRYAAPAGTAESTIVHPTRGKLKITSTDNRPVVLETETYGDVDVWSEARNSPPRRNGYWP